MLTFREFLREFFLLEGGNLINPATGETASPIPLENREAASGDIHGIVNHFRGIAGVAPLEREHLHKSTFGSTEQMTNPEVSTKQLKGAGKDEFGDTDIGLTKKDKNGNQIDYGKHLRVGMVVGNRKLVHVKESVGGGGHYTLWEHVDHPNDSKRMIQIDMNYVDHETDKDGHYVPTAAEKDARSSPLRDLMEGHKGYVSKFARMAFAKVGGKEVHPMGKKGPQNRTINDAYTYSVNPPGLRPTAGENILGYHPETGLPVKEELPSKGAKRISDPREQLEELHRARELPSPTEEDHENYKSFEGIKDLLNKHYSPEDHQQFFGHMTRKLFGEHTTNKNGEKSFKPAQSVYRFDIKGNPEKDLRGKDNVVKSLFKSFPHLDTQENRNHVAKIRKAYIDHHTTRAAQGKADVEEV